MASTGKSQKIAKRALCPFINSQIIEAADARSVPLLLGAVQRHLPDMNLVNLTTALHRLAKVCSDNPDARAQMRCAAHQQTLQELLSGLSTALLKSETQLNESRRQALGNIVWSLGTLRCVQLQLVQVAANLAMGQLSLFKPFELASTIWAFAKLGSLHPTAREIVAPVQVAAIGPLSSVVSKLGFRFLAMAAWALVASGLSQEPVMNKIASRVLPMLHGQDALPELVLDIAWAFSSAGLRHERLLVGVARQAGRNLSRFAAGELSELCEILAREQVDCPEFLQACAGYCELVPMAPQHLRTMQTAIVSLHSPLRATAPEFVPTARAAGVAAPAAAQMARPAGIWATCPVDICKAEAQRATGSTSLGEELDAGYAASEASDWDSDAPEVAAPDASVSGGVAARGSRAWADVNEDADADEAPEFSPAQDLQDSASTSSTATREGSVHVATYKVKNTFLELTEEEVAEEDAAMLRRLPAALEVALAQRPAEELEALRLRYQKLREW